MTTPANEARIRRRDLFLANAQDQLFQVVTECAKRVPMREIAAVIDGDDEAGTFEASAGTRATIAQFVRARAVRDEEIDALDALVASLAKYEHGFLPCVFLVKLPGGVTEVSAVALTMEVIN